MRENVVVDGLNVEGLLKSLHQMVSSGIISNNTIVVLDTFDGYRHGIQELILENEGVLTISAKIHADF